MWITFFLNCGQTVICNIFRGIHRKITMKWLSAITAPPHCISFTLAAFIWLQVPTSLSAGSDHSDAQQNIFGRLCKTVPGALIVTWTMLAWSFKMTSQRTSVLLSHRQQTTNCLGQTRGPKTRTRLRMKVKYSRYIKQRLIWRWRRTGPAGREVVILRHSRSTVRARQENTRHNSSVKFKMADMFTTPEWSLSGLMRTLEEGRNRQWQLTEEEKTVPLSWSKQRLQVQVLQNLTERLSGFIFPPLQFQWIKLFFALFLHPGVTRQ